MHDPARSTTQPGTLGTLKDGAARCGTHERTIRRMVSRGDLTAYRLPGTRLLRIDLDELDAALRPIPSGLAG